MAMKLLLNPDTDSRRIERSRIVSEGRHNRFSGEL
jgi:hypothetical protein